jgi:hypothetical protein
MRIKTSLENVQQAVEVINERYDGNIRFDLTRVEHYRGVDTVIGVLRVNDSKGKGVQRAASGRLTTMACLHAHGYLFDALPEGTPISTARATLKAGDDWSDIDPKKGSRINPVWMSELCDCWQWE